MPTFPPTTSTRPTSWAGDTRTTLPAPERLRKELGRRHGPNDVDLTGADRAFANVEALFRHLGLGALGSSDGTGFIVGDVWDDLAIVEVGSEERGWNLIGCPQQGAVEVLARRVPPFGAALTATACSSWELVGAAPENIVYYGLSLPAPTTAGTTSPRKTSAFDLSPWAGETVDVRFRFRTASKST